MILIVLTDYRRNNMGHDILKAHQCNEVMADINDFLLIRDWLGYNQSYNKWNNND